MKKDLLLLLLLFFCKPFLFGQVPINNPFNSRYHLNGHWTDSLPWKNVTTAGDMPGLVDKNGQVDSAILHNTMKTISDKGGGVLYFPAGQYYLNFNVTLYNGVILRGADPKGILDATNNGYRPPTKFIFPKYIPSFQGNGTPDNTAFKQIADENNADFGLINIDIDRAPVYAPDSKNKSNIIIFGIRSNNSTDHRSLFLANANGHAWQRYPTTFVGNIFITFQKGVVANCRINDSITDDFEMPDFMTNEGHIFKDTKIKFQYGLQSGIYVNNFDFKPAKVELLDNYVKAFYVSKIGENFYGEKIMKGNQFLYLPCQDLVSDEFYSKENEKHTDEAFEKQWYITKEQDTLNYSILKPINYDPQKKYPFVLFFHGLGQHGDKNPLIHYVYIYSDDVIRNKYPYFVVVPHIKTKERFSTSLNAPPTRSFQLSIDLMKELEEKYSIDTNRTYVAGVSSGGAAVIEAVIRHPKLFKTAILMNSIRPVSDDQLKRIKDINFIICAGTGDEILEPIRNAVSVLKDQGTKVDYFEYKGAGHWGWINLCTDKNFLNLIFKEM